ncbi:MAG TPA: (d)CMP kinase [Deinococcales bacterium]|nr:(d)CMP kinase [Deinococcales bacterium]
MNGPGVVTIDGPAASGKSSVARAVAAQLGVPFVSSGLLYRGATWLLQEAGIEPQDERSVLAELQRHSVRLDDGVSSSGLVLDGTARSAELHTDEIDASVSIVAAYPGVREWANRQLRQLEGSFIVEGRDMGTAVFPGAPHKFFLDAPVHVRAERRLGERKAGLLELREQLARRDLLDSRQLRPAEDAVRIDTEHLDLEEVTALVLGSIAGQAEPG